MADGSESSRPGELIGRGVELQLLASWLADADGLPAAMIVDGEAGIGKTSLVRAATAEARRAGYSVLEASPAEPEIGLAYIALGDLIGGWLDQVLPALADPQRVALEVALLRRTDGGSPVDPRAVALALLNGLKCLAERTPVLVVVDDAQWLDAASAAALRFALRRLRAERVAILFAVRTGDARGGPAATGLPAIDHIGLGPMSLGAIHTLIRQRLGLVLSRPVLRRLHELSDGNPFYALELGRAVGDERLSLTPGEAIPADLHALVGTRIGGLSTEIREFLAACAASSRPTLELIAGTLPAIDIAAVSAAAVESGVVRVIDDEVGFGHPLLASAAYAGLDRDRRRALHARLAEVVPDPLERARHLALAATGPDAHVAVDVESAAAVTFSRGATADAAELMALARGLTPADARHDQRRRALLEAQYRFESGSTAAAAELLERLMTTTPPGAARAEVLARLAWVRHFEADVGGGVALLRRALSETRPDDAIRAEVEEGLAWGLLLMRSDLTAASRYARSAAKRAEQRGDPAALAQALAAVALIGFVSGRGSSEAMERALVLEPFTLHLRVLQHPSFALGYVLACSDELDRAEAVFTELRRRADERGDESALATIGFHLSTIACERGDLATAMRIAEEAQDLAVQDGQLPTQAAALGWLALVLARQGDVERAREAGTRSLTLAGGPSFDPAEPAGALARGGEYALWALGELELSVGRPEETDRYLGPLTASLLDGGVREPGELRFLPSEVEALTMLGRLGSADHLVGVLESAARRTRRPSVQASALASRAIVQAARGDVPHAIDLLEKAAHHAGDAPLTFERARVLLHLGRLQRRLGRKRSARERLLQAREAFEGMGARSWSASAAAELHRIGGRSPAQGRLTSSERRVAALVARGLTNKEVAAELFVSPKAIEVSLSRIYAKRGIRSRTELASVLLAEG